MPRSARALRLWFRVASRIAPSVAERQAAGIFLTPRRRKRAQVGAVPDGASRVWLDGDLPLAGWEWGLRPKPVVLLVHGWSGLASDMATVARALVAEGFRAVAFDMPAHGRSPGRRTSLVEWMRALDAIGRWSGGLHGVLGHSFGATAVTLALEDGLRAPRAVLVSTASGPMHYVERVRRFIGLPEERVPGMVRELVAHVGREIPHFEATRAARSLDLPALLLHDPEDDEAPWSHARTVAESWRGSRIEARSGVGHFRILRDPETVARAVGFLASA